MSVWTAAYFGSYIISYLVTLLAGQYTFNRDSLLQMIISLSLLMLFALATTLLANLIAIALGSSYAFIVVFALQTFSIAILLPFGNLTRILTNIEQLAFRLNPIANLVYAWHLPLGENPLACLPPNTLVLSGSLIYFAVLNLLVIIIGAVIVNKVTVSISDKEENG